MAPRPTIKQAIELLKIHQLRRENAAIFQEINNLRTEVSDLYDASRETQQQLDGSKLDLQEYRHLTGQYSKQLNDVQVAVRSLTQDGGISRSELESLQAQFHKQSDFCHNQNARVLQKIKEVERMQQDIGCKQDKVEQNLRDDLKRWQQQLAQKANTEQLQAIQSRLDTIQYSIDLVEDREHAEKSTSCVYDSIEGNSTRVYDEIQKERDSCHGELTCTTQSLASDYAPALKPQQRARTSTVPNDLDLDENTAATSYVDRVGNVATTSDSFTKSQYQTDKDTSLINRILSLKQLPEENLTAYLKRGCELTDRLPVGSEDIMIHRIVDYLCVESEQEVFSKWLNATSWSKQNLMDIACLQGVSRLDLLHSTEVLTNPLQPSSGASIQPDIIIPATNNLTQPVQPSRRKTIQQGCLRTDVRRSQRLVAKSQTQVQRVQDEPVVTKEQGNIANAYATKPADSLKRRKACQIELSFPQAESKGKQTIVLTATTLKNRRQPGANSKPINVEVAKQCPVSPQQVHQHSISEPAGVLATGEYELEHDLSRSINLLQTPTRRIYQGKSIYKPPLKQPTQPSTTVHSKVVNHGRNSVIPSPYHPQPRLVPANSMARMDNHRHELPSDSDVFLPRCEQQVQRTNNAVNEQQRVGPAKKQRRLPLPPPPEIPILSTSTEEDRRFDQW